MAIEYSSDVLIGLQYDGMDYESGESEKNRLNRIRTLMQDMIARGKRGEPQRIQVKILKNRNGSKGDAYLDFIPMFNCFKDSIDNAEGKDDLVTGGWVSVQEKLPDEWTGKKRR